MNKNGRLIFSIILILFILFGLYIFFSTKIIKEGYRDTNRNYTVDLPLTTTTSCSNFCAPATASCAITGEQCTSDMDCYGCEEPPKQKAPYTPSVHAYNDAGKLTEGVTPTFSVLTTDIGTRAFQIKSDNSPPPTYQKGTNTWIDAFDEGQALYEKRYNPQFEVITSLPKYPSTPTLTGEFVTTGPLASNADLSGV